LFSILVRRRIRTSGAILAVDKRDTRHLDGSFSACIGPADLGMKAPFVGLDGDSQNEPTSRPVWIADVPREKCRSAQVSLIYINFSRSERRNLSCSESS
jgi:hypothetical protein